jgi:Short C-terminal domain
VRLRQPVAYVVGLAACAAITWGVRGLTLTGECGEYPAPPCPPESVPYFLAVGIGLPVAIIAAIAGGRLLIAAIFTAPGIAMVWAALDQPADQRLPLLVFGALLAAGPVLLLAVILLVHARKAGLAEQLVGGGAKAVGTVTGIRDTGVTINKNPRVVLTLRIEPLDGSPPFDGTMRLTVSRVDLPYPGKRFPVWFDRANPRRFVLGTPEPAAPADPLDRLAKLNELRLAGALTQAEFEAQKARLLRQ